MSESKITVNIFIASSGELQEERQMMLSLFRDINNLLPHIQIKDVRWEVDMESGSVEGDRVQDDINRFLDMCPIVIALFYSKIGTFTFEEYDHSMRKRKKVFVYFKQGFSPDEEAKALQFAELLRFRDRLNRENRVLYKKFFGVPDLQMQLYNDLLLYLREKYPFETPSVMRIFNGIKLQAKEKTVLKNFSCLPSSYYSIGEIASFFKMDSDALNESISLLVGKGIILHNEVTDKYCVQDAIRRELLSMIKYDGGFSTLIDVMIEKLNIVYLPGGNQHLQNLQMVEGFLSNLENHNNTEIGRLKEKLAVTYMLTFGINSQSAAHMQKSILLLQQILYEDTPEKTVSAEVKAKRKRLLAEIYSGMAELEFDPAAKNRMFESVSRLLQEIDPAVISDKLESLRFYVLHISNALRTESAGENVRNKLVALFTGSNNYIDLLALSNRELFEKICSLSWRLNALGLCEDILKKIIDLEEREYGEQNFRLFRLYLDFGELMMTQNNKDESIKYLRKAQKIATSSTDADAQLVNAKIALWTQTFVLV